MARIHLEAAESVENGREYVVRYGWAEGRTVHVLGAVLNDAGGPHEEDVWVLIDGETRVCSRHALALPGSPRNAARAPRPAAGS